ncbi:hypothetical protein E0Z10_g1598 [Xylaria hypoxylon]|uniref:Heterokaryon incompatibility domain-containing protein n=1 Tax=Xylaria hypoxylon TaxID=37992 RepID=A0A4Z0ZC63_9PEZI|nr:hypothetical protein E0Z10_g1598 [Xylaria hypoxylon]
METGTANHIMNDAEGSLSPSFFSICVIDVKDANIGVVRLRNAEDVNIMSRDGGRRGARGSCPAYWTLSHRWGDASNILQLTKNTEQDFSKSISTDNLPPTFRDAALLVQRLGFRYLWIDSLCIFQDSLSDWHQQTNAMVNIYRNSYCNISAVGSSYNPSTERLFKERTWSRRLLYPFVVKGDFQPFVDDPDDDLSDRRWVGWNNSMWHHEIEKAPLSTHAWVVQERFLATRVIHFAQNQIFWECLGSIRCGIDPNSTLMTMRTTIRFCDTTTEYKSSRLELESYTATDARSGHTSKLGLNLYHEWKAIVSVYTGCKLTKESDRLVALSGIAKMFREISGDTYIAGLWKGMIHIDFAWTSNAIQGIPARRSAFYAPSWSWASIVGGQVQLYLDHRADTGSKPLMKLRAASTLVKGHKTHSRMCLQDPRTFYGDPAGALCSAELDIVCIPYYYRWVSQGEELSLYGDEKMTNHRLDLDGTLQIGKSGGWFKRLYLDTADLVDQFAEADNMEAMCVPFMEDYRLGGTNWVIQG